MRSLYQCSHAIVEQGDRIRCAKGCTLGMHNDGSMSAMPLHRGQPLELTICQTCDYYDEMGPPVEAKDRGQFAPYNAIKRKGDRR